MKCTVVPGKYFKQNGFTLLELLIAIALFSIVSIAAFRLFDTVANTKQATEKSLTRINQLQRALLIIEKDLSQITPRPIRNELGDKQPAFIANKDGFLIEFSKAGWRNPSYAKRSNIQRVAYIFEASDGQLIRQYWLALDRPGEIKPKQQVLIEKLQNVSVRFLDQDRKWKTEWSTPASSQQVQGLPGGGQKQDPNKKVPLGIEITLTDPRYGQVNKIIMGITIPQPDQQGSSNTQGLPKPPQT
ncbi:type II secretion system minor pseudopilin GspJ [Endozoicomonas sp. SM1973]|uniref:Type II secretion system protein J n=1 Tax=Spartinivicinus marinus TaxID=2994442 RepID=A0A853IDQ8_9GAMM|nr:type II secretion system minor pseudopilin GspJ [Spartinivicinus marinus]MCX4024955.1 type II secretion system minor pseudopilin GspJ [Spartinivicinus marinus]NYZ67647.1 type II secretion system minor pseudopilin GspJ [Spartinivicinus marinus]